MSIEIIPIEKQGEGNFNGGAILEKKPIPFAGDTKGSRPYSNLFYWAHAWSEKGSTIGEHPHQAFEIMSFVLKGDIRHYDSKNKAWVPLHEGDVQIIRAGNGICYICYEDCKTATVSPYGGMLEYTPEAQRGGLTLWPQPNTDLAIMQRIKGMLDPNALLNKGRLYGRI